jgi:hypothetical protein
VPAAVDGSSPARWTASVAPGGSTTSSSFTAPADALLVACVNHDGNSGGTDPFNVASFSDSGGLTWTERVRRAEAETTDGGTAIIWTARTTSSVSRTATLSRTGGSASKRVSCRLYVVTGVDVDGTPVDTVGANNEGGSGTNDLTTSSITPGATGLLFACDTDWNQLGTLTSSDLTLDTADYAGEISVASGYKTCTSGVGVTANLNAGGAAAAQHKWCQIVVRESAVVTGLAIHRNAHVPYVGGGWLMPPNGRR